MNHGPLVDPETVPPWLRQLVRATAEVDVSVFRRLAAFTPDPRSAAVLVLFGEDDSHGPDVLLQRRAAGDDTHSGQVSFPGGSAEDSDDGPVATALREAVEETGLDPAGVRPLAVLPELHIPVSRFEVTPVLAHWERPSVVRAVNPAESSAVARVPLETLTEPANRFMVRHPSGYLGPAFAAPGMLVWGFTAGVLTLIFAAAGWERPWDHKDVRDLGVAWRAIDAGDGGPTT